MSAKTGAGSLVNPDNIKIYRASVIGLIAVALAVGAASAEALVFVSDWMATPVYLWWTLPVAYDVFLIVLALATLALRRRRAWFHVVWMSLLTLALVAVSATANYLYVRHETGLVTVEDNAGAWMKASFPFLLLFAIEVLAALTSTRSQRADSALERERVAHSKSRAKIRELRASLEAATTAPPRFAWLERRSVRAARQAAIATPAGGEVE